MTVRSPLRDDARAAALSIAERLRDPGIVSRAIEQAPRQTTVPRFLPWRPYALGYGYAGLALTFAEFDRSFPEQAWDRVGHDALERAARAAATFPAIHTGVYSGLSGVALAAWLLSRGGRRYRALRDTLDRMLLPRLEARALAVGASRGVPYGDFDTISGLAGALAVLLLRNDPAARRTAATIITALIHLSRVEASLPAWFTPGDRLPEETRAAYPDGCVNMGLAHGVPGPLAAMALARLSGFEADGLDEAIDRTAEWILSVGGDDNCGPNWPTAVRLPLAATSRTQWNRPPSRAAWCYGSPGLARALWLAGVARGRRDLRDAAIEAMEAVYCRPISERHILSATLCHGVAGLLAITVRFEKDTGLRVFSGASADLTRQIMDQLEPDSILGVRHLEGGGSRVDHAGFLDGAPGTALALLAAGSDTAPTWDRALLLA